MGNSPQVQAAVEYLRHKGYPDLSPTHVVEVEDSLLWYVSFQLDDDEEVELEVEFEGGEWVVAVTSIR